MLFSLAKINRTLDLITVEGPGVYFVVGSRSLRILHARLESVMMDPTAITRLSGGINYSWRLAVQSEV